MKNLITTLCFVCFICSNQAIIAQEIVDVSEKIPTNYKKRNAVYDYSETQLNNTDTIPDFDSKPNKLMISGTIFQSDGITPASDIILFIHQPDEEGNYELKRDSNRKRYIKHRGWIKTNADGQYTFYTFMPGTEMYSKELKHIHRTIKEPGKPEYDIESFFFNDDPLIPELTLACRARLIKSMLKLEKKGDMYVATKDIILEGNTPEYK